MAIDTYAVIGNPVNHSLSPYIHTLFAKQTGESLLYKTLTAPVDQFEHCVKQFVEQGGKGLNVTAPFKEQAFHLAASTSPRAKIAKSVNTLSFNTTSYGDNTDGIGFIRDIEINHQYSLTDKRVLIFGAGGAVRGILQVILARKPARVVIANRNLMRAKCLSEEFCAYGSVCTSELTTMTGTFDFVINAISSSSTLIWQSVSLALDTNSFCYDLAYRREPTPFLQWASAQGAFEVSDGIGMLVEQAAESFFIWRDVKPITNPVINSIRQQLK